MIGQMGLIELIISKVSFDEFKKAIHSIETEKIIDLLEGWGKRYFKSRYKDYMDEVRRFLAKIVYEIGERIN